MKKIFLLLALSPFLLAMQCGEDDSPCGKFIEFEKPDLVTIENQQTTYSVGDVLWLSASVDRIQTNPVTNSTYDLFQSDEKLLYYVDFRKASNYNGYYQLYLNENTTVVEHGEINWNNIILVKSGEQFKSKIGIKLLEPGSYTLYFYNVASYNPERMGCNFTVYSMISNFDGMDGGMFSFEVE